MKKLRVLGVCTGQGALLSFKKNLLGNIEIRGVFGTCGRRTMEIKFWRYDRSIRAFVYKNSMRK